MRNAVFFLCCLAAVLLLSVLISPSHAASLEVDPPPVPSPNAPSMPQPAHNAGKPTFCAGEDKVWSAERDSDVIIKEGANLTVMFHGNRFPASADIVAAFEKANPGIKVTYSSLPPISVVRKLNGQDSTKGAEVKDISKKIAPLDYPDVVMVPVDNLVLDLYGDNLINPAMYSRIHGVVAVMRADDKKINKIEDLKTTDIHFVLAGMQHPSHALYRVPEAFFGKELFEQIKKRPSTGYSLLTHHRSIPARILLGCSDVGFQFAQSQAYLEKRFPGKFKFLQLPESIPGIYDSENSYISITKNSTHRDAAAKFRDFVLGPEGQAILARYRLESAK